MLITKIRSSILLPILCWSWIGFIAAARYSSAQTSLDLQMYPGLTIPGPVGAIYSVEYANNLSQSNQWRCLDFVRLATTNYFWVDRNAPAGSRRFYRAVLDTR